MWKLTEEKFNKYPSQLKVAKKILELGLCVGEDNKIYCGNVEINLSSLARSLDIDRRVINSTIDTILNDDELEQIFTNIEPSGPLLKNIASMLNLGVIELEGSGEKYGILSKIAIVLSDAKLSIRQLYASDPELSQVPKITIITSKPVDGNLLQELLKIDGISKVSIY